MNSTIYDLLMITSFDLDRLIEDYRQFFLALLPGMFIFACLIEYFDKMNVFDLFKRGIIAVIILTSVTSFYKESIKYSIDAADTKFSEQKSKNILLMDMFEAAKFFDRIDDKEKDFIKDHGYLKGGLKFIKYHFFDSFINDGFTIGVYFISQLCFVLIKVIYSLVYYLGYGLMGIPILIYLFPTMGNVLRGGILSYIWCLIVPHVLVFVLSMIGAEINRGYDSGQVIGGSITGTVLLFLLTLFIAFTPFISMMLINGSGIAQAGGMMALIGGHFIRSLPMQGVNSGASMISGGSLGPKGKVAVGVVSTGGSFMIQAFNGSIKRLSDLRGANRSGFNNFSGGKKSMSAENKNLDANSIIQRIKSFSSSLDMSQRLSRGHSSSSDQVKSASEVRFKLSNNSNHLRKVNNEQENKGSKRQFTKSDEYSTSGTNNKKTNGINRNFRSISKPKSSDYSDNRLKRRESNKA